jgi:uncharacterized protein YsxB (DUF464 family)
MITVTVSKNEDGICNRICMHGHAGYAAYGQDIVCAAASALFINTANAIEKFTDDDFCVNQDTKTDQVILQLTSPISEKSKLLVDSLLLGLQGIEEEYSSEYIRVIFQ